MPEFRYRAIPVVEMFPQRGSAENGRQLVAGVGGLSFLLCRCLGRHLVGCRSIDRRKKAIYGIGRRPDFSCRSHRFEDMHLSVDASAAFENIPIASDQRRVPRNKLQASTDGNLRLRREEIGRIEKRSHD